MKKSIFILAALFAATFANAQITLEKTFGSMVDLGSEVPILQGYSIVHGSRQSRAFPLVVGPYIVETQWTGSAAVYDVYDFNTLTLLKTFTSTDLVPAGDHYGLISRGIFTTDNKWAWAYIQNDELFIVTEDNTELLRVNNCTGYSGEPFIIKVNEQYKLVVTVKAGDMSYETQLYSLPGKGDTGQDIETPVAPRSSARKVLKKDQVLVENADKTYTLQGQEVK